jgi:superfamily I DNA and/or RNA helicase
MKGWRKAALASGAKYLTNWAADNGISKHNVEVGKTIEELVIVRTEIETLEKSRELLTQESNALKDETHTTSREALDQLSEDLDELKEELKKKRTRRKELEAHLVELEDIGSDLLKQSADDLRDWVKEYLPKTPENQKYLELQSIYTDWQERFGLSPAFNAALLTSCQVVAGTCLGIMSIKGIEELDYDLCIIDESSKATPTEALIPISRSRRWVLVGDQRQLSPFQDASFRDSKILEKYDLTRADLKHTLFDHLVDNLPVECCSSLNIQHRMVAPIGNLISHCFYDGRLTSAEKEIDTALSFIFKRPVTWFTTEHLPNKSESRSASSYVNRCEVEVVKKLLGQIDWLCKSYGKKYSIALLVGYTGQKREMERTLNTELNNWKQLEIIIETIDAFQGREADIALYSVTRSNTKGKIGFLYEQERINVALSRGRYYLGVIGDRNFCYAIERDNPFRHVIEYIEQHPQDCAINKEYQ